MTFTEEHHTFRMMVRDLIASEVTPHVDKWEAEGMMPLRDVFQRFAKVGALGVEHATEHGGQGGDHRFTVIVGEELGRCGSGSFPMAYGVQTDMATPSLARYGTDEQKAAFLEPALRGDMVTAIVVTEPDAGSDVAGIQTRAVRDGDDWVINGSKMYITNALQADWMCVLARTSDEGGHAGMSQIIVPTGGEGLEMSKLDKLGMRASDTGLLTFTDYHVPVANTIGTEGRGFQQQMEQFVIERMWVVYTAVGGCLEALERTKQYAKDRHLFGGALIDNQFVAYKLADLAAELDMLRVYSYAIADAHEAAKRPDAPRGAAMQTTRMATIAKLKAGRLVREVGEWCLQFHGGLGFMEETWTARFVRDNVLAGIGGGSNETMQRILTMTEGYHA